MWSDELANQARNAAAGDHALNAEYSRRKGIQVPKGARFLELKEKFLEEELKTFRKQAFDRKK